MAQAGQRKVLIALDTSEAGKQVLDFYFDNIMRPNDYVYGVTVVEYDVASLSTTIKSAGGGNPIEISNHFTEQFKENEKKTADYAAELRKRNVKGQCDSYNGKPGPCICDTAAMLDADIIIMGTRGLGKIKRAILGSVSNYVINYVGRPVVILPTGN